MVRRTDSPEPPRVPTAEEAGRAALLRRRFGGFRASPPRLGPGEHAVAAGLVETFAALAVPEFADWVVVDVVDEAGATVRIRLAHAEGSEDAAARHLDGAAPGLAGVVDRVIASGATETWPEGGAGPTVIVVGLRVKDRTYGAVSFVLGPGRDPYEMSDIVACEEAAWGLGSLIERRVLQEESRTALRETQRMARQLHQLFAATVTVSGARDEEEIAATVAQSARRVFDADLATFELATGVTAWAVRGQTRASVGGRPPEEVPEDGGDGPRRSADWLIVPVEERRAPRYGVLGVRRGGRPLSVEDLEIATLLAQAAATALHARALARGIERSEARLRALVETAPIGIVEASSSGVPRWWNRAAERIFGWPPADEGAEPVVPRPLASALVEMATEVRESGGSALRDLVDVTVKGRARDLTTAAALVAVPEEADPTLMVLIDDVTDHRQLKAEVAHAQQMELRGEVASRVAHDFNNLITLITGYAELLGRELVDERQVGMVRDVQSTASRASRLVAQLQSIGREPVLDPVVLVPADVVRADAEVLERVVGGDVELELALSGDGLATRVDAGQFEQMLLNLAMNARDAMPDGGRLRVGVDGVELDEAGARPLGVAPGPFVRLSVSDTGAGMDDETLAHCFDAFFTTKGPLRGTGMGLASARRLAEASGGAITVRSAPGAGTTFEVLFPLTREAVVVELASAAQRRERGFATVLVADDDEGLRRLMVQVLARNGYQVLEAESGERALEIAGRYDGVIELLVSDVAMGELSGPDLAVALQTSRPELRVLLTSGTADATVLAGLSPGTSAFLKKPFKPSALIDAVHDLLARVVAAP